MKRECQSGQWQAVLKCRVFMCQASLKMATLHALGISGLPKKAFGCLKSNWATNLLGKQSNGPHMHQNVVALQLQPTSQSVEPNEHL